MSGVALAFGAVCGGIVARITVCYLVIALLTLFRTSVDVFLFWTFHYTLLECGVVGSQESGYVITR